MVRKKIKTHVRKAQIREAAMRIIARHGVNGLTISSIAGEVGMAESNVYRHFRSKHEVVADLIGEIVSRIKKIVKGAFKDHGDLRVCLERIFHDHLALMDKQRGVLRILASDEMHAQGGDLFLELRQMMTWYLAQVKKAIHQGRGQGVFCQTLDPAAAAAAFLGLIQSSVLQWFVFGYSYSLKKRSRHIWKVYQEGILCR